MFRELQFGTGGGGDFDTAKERIESNYPRTAQDIFDDLVAVQDRRFAALRANSDKAAGIREEIGGLRLTIKLAEADKATHADKWTPEIEANLERKRSRLIKLQEQVVELTTRPSEPPLDPLVNELNGRSFLEFIATQPARLCFDEAPSVKPTSTLAKIKSQLTSTHAEFRALRTQAPAWDEACEALKREIAAHGQLATFDLSGLLRPRRNRAGQYSTGSVRFPEQHQFIQQRAILDQRGTSLVCRLLPDAVFELLEPQLREQLKDPGLPMAERLARETELKSKWIELQRHFVALTLADGLPMPLAHPYAILGVMPGTTRDLRQNYLTVTEDAGAPLNVGLPVKDLPTLEEQGVPDIPRRNRRARK